MAAALLCGLAAAVCSPVLVRDGQPEATILLSPSASANEKLAAAELQGYVRKISGATLPVMIGDRPQTRTAVRIGVFGAEPVAGWDGDRPMPDGFTLARRGDDLWIVGGDGRGALYGVYDFLERELEVRWFTPEELGEDFPNQATIPLPPLRRSKQPAFAAVSGFIWAGGPGAEAWEKRIRAQVGSRLAFFGHNWANIIAPTPANLQAHPEWFALVGGVRRTSQLCSAHPDVVRITAERAREFFAKNPDAPLFSISPNDGLGFCEDSLCRAVDARYGVTDGSITDRLVHYANEVLAELEKTHPGKQVGILAYVSHTRPPVSAKPHPNYATLICHTPWEFCHVHALDDASCEYNRRFLEYVQGWRQVARHVGVYDYYGHFFVFAPWPIWHSIRRDVPLLHRLGVDRFESESSQNWANHGLNFYLGAKLAWDPDLDADALLADYFSRFYGRAAQPMRRYWERWEEAMIATAPAGHGGYEWLRMYTPELATECERYLAEGERLAASDSEKVQRRVAFARLGFRFTEVYARMLEHTRRGEWEQAIADAEECIRRVEATAGTEPQAFWNWLAVTQLQYMIREFRQGRLGI